MVLGEMGFQNRELVTIFSHIILILNFIGSLPSPWEVGGEPSSREDSFTMILVDSYRILTKCPLQGTTFPIRMMSDLGMVTFPCSNCFCWKWWNVQIWEILLINLVSWWVIVIVIQHKNRPFRLTCLCQPRWPIKVNPICLPLAITL